MAEEIAPSCEGCAFFEKHGKNCFYYWELKKDCTMHSGKQ